MCDCDFWFLLSPLRGSWRHREPWPLQTSARVSGEREHSLAKPWCSPHGQEGPALLRHRHLLPGHIPRKLHGGRTSSPYMSLFSRAAPQPPLVVLTLRFCRVLWDGPLWVCLVFPGGWIRVTLSGQEPHSSDVMSSQGCMSGGTPCPFCS